MEEDTFHIFGKVQGVYFRANAKKIAANLGICGFAKNEKDGSVTIVAQGPKATLIEFENWCQSSPGNARVEKIIKKERPVKLKFSGFEIK